jgi:thymidylate synthase (FAD)
MLLIKPSTKILHITPEPLQMIELAGRTCYKSEDKITADSAPRFTEMLLARGHESVFEHVTVTVRFICDRGISHQLVRHRVASYSQESTRYCDHKEGHITFILPPWVDVEPGEYNDFDFCSEEELSYFGDDEFIWMTAMNEAEKDYKYLRAKGWTPQQARSVLPSSLKTELVMTANLREWRHFFKLRTDTTAHPQMREIAIPLLAEFAKRIPVVFDDLKIN